MGWYSHLFQNFPQFVVIHTVKGFGIVNNTDVFLELSCFFYDPLDIGTLSSFKKEILTPATVWMNFEDVMISEISQKKKTNTI